MTDALYAQLPEEFRQFHLDYKDLIENAKGSEIKHQAWIGGYKDHILQCFDISARLYTAIDFSEFFELYSAQKVLYFHDIEKLWRDNTEFDKDTFLGIELSHQYDIVFSDEEWNAIRYVHGEGDDYCEKRVMGPLAAFCHAVDTMSARIFYDKKTI